MIVGVGDTDAASSASVARPSRSAWRITWYVAVAAFALFAALQRVLLTAAHHADVARMGRGMAYDVAPEWWASLGRFAAVAGAAVLAASLGRRALATVPALLLVFLPVVTSATSFMIGRPGTPLPLGVGWYLRTSLYAPPPSWLLWFGAVVDVTLALGPAAALALVQRRDLIRTHVTTVDVAALACCVTALWLYADERVLLDASGRALSTELLSLLPMFAVGLACTGRRAWRVGAALVLALLASVDVVIAFAGPNVWHVATLRESWSPAVPAVVAAALGAMWTPLSRGLRRLEAQTAVLVIAVNGLNVADAVLTWLSVRGGDAVEANPLVKLIGLPAKIVIVGAASVWLARTRPRALVAPALVLAAVLGYHLVGLRVNA